MFVSVCVTVCVYDQQVVVIESNEQNRVTQIMMNSDRETSLHLTISSRCTVLIQ